MHKQVFGLLGFLVILTIYVTVLVALAPELPIVFLTALQAWMIIRQPMSHPDRMDSDLEVFRTKTGEAAGKLVEVLVRPLTRVP